MNKKSSKFIIYTSNFTGVHIPVIENLIINRIEIACIIYEKKLSQKISLSDKIKTIFRRWGDPRLIPFYLEYKNNINKYIRPRQKHSIKARSDKNYNLNEFNNLDDLCERHKIKMVSINDLNSDECIEIQEKFKPDFGIALASRILKKEIFSIPYHGTINLHSMLLPKYKGLSPVGFRETIAGEKFCGIHIHFIEPSLDTGPIISSEFIDLTNHKFCLESIGNEAIDISGPLMVKAINKIQNGAEGEPQAKLLKNKIYKMPTKKEMLEFYKIKTKRLLEL
tara:strand:- start:275 stop:1114 length:840 start_codon:yes stop_codon:yes gene_type:complete